MVSERNVRVLIWSTILVLAVLAVGLLSFRASKFERLSPATITDDPNLSYSTLGSRSRPENVGDGDLFTFWTGNTQPSSKNWLEFRFDQPVNLNRVVLSSNKARFPKKITVRSEIVPTEGPEQGLKVLQEVETFRVRGPRVRLKLPQPVISSRFMLWFEEGNINDGKIEIHEVELLSQRDRDLMAGLSSSLRSLGLAGLAILVVLAIHLLFLFVGGRPRSSRAIDLMVGYGRGLALFGVIGISVGLGSTLLAWLGLLFAVIQIILAVREGSLLGLIQSRVFKLLAASQLIVLLILIFRLIVEGFFFQADFLQPFYLSQLVETGQSLFSEKAVETLFGWQALDRTPLLSVIFTGLSGFSGLSFSLYVLLQAVLASLLSLAALSLLEFLSIKENWRQNLALLVAISPYFLITGAIYPTRPVVAFFLVLSVIVLFQSQNLKSGLLASLFAALAFLAHPMALFYIPLFAIGYLVEKKNLLSTLVFLLLPGLSYLGFTIAGRLLEMPSRLFLYFFAVKDEYEYFQFSRPELIERFLQTPVIEIVGNRLQNLGSLFMPLQKSFFGDISHLNTWLIWGALFFTLLPFLLPAFKKVWREKRPLLIYLVLLPALFQTLFLGFPAPQALLFPLPAVLILLTLLFSQASARMERYLWLAGLEFALIFLLPTIVGYSV